MTKEKIENLYRELKKEINLFYNERNLKENLYSHETIARCTDGDFLDLSLQINKANRPSYKEQPLSNILNNIELKNEKIFDLTNKVLPLVKENHCEFNNRDTVINTDNVDQFLKVVLESESNKFQGVFKGYRYKAYRHVILSGLCSHIYWCGYVYHKNILHEDILDNLRVHGGISYNKDLIIGFDCSHGGVDLFSNHEHFKTEYATYKNKAFVKWQIKKLINQLIKLENIKN
jgi:hypothetical protein